MGEVPLYLEAKPHRYVAPSDMPSPPAALASPLTSVEDKEFMVLGLGFEVWG